MFIYLSSIVIIIFFGRGGYTTLHEIRRKRKQNEVVLKLDFEKVYDKVNCDFLQQTLRMKGFSPLWCSWIESIVSVGSVGQK